MEERKERKKEKIKDKFLTLKNFMQEAEEMVLQLRAPALTENQGSVLSTHTMAHTNSSLRVSSALF